MKLFIEPHIDDAAIGCGILMSKLAQKKEEFCILSLTHYEYDDNHEQARKIFKKYFKDFCNIHFFDLSLTHEVRTIFPQYYELLKLNIEYQYQNIIENFDITEVYFPAADNHIDHEITNRICKQIIRPTNGSKIDTIVEYEIPNSNLEFGNNSKIDFNKFVFGSKIDLNFKKKLLKIYTKYYNLKTNSDFRSAEYVLKHNELLGIKYGYDCGERYNILFTRK